MEIVKSNYDTWVISDTHFHHQNILNFVDSQTGLKVRPQFSTVDEMDEYIVERWNSVVKKGDKVYHLGDVFMDDPNKFKKLWPRLNGRKNLIVGNHDDIKFLSSGGFFKSVYLERKFRDLRLHLSHIPLHPSQHEAGAPGSGKFYVNVHGHIHQNPSPVGRYINVSVEATDYTPVHLDVLAEKAKTLLFLYGN